MDKSYPKTSQSHTNEMMPLHTLEHHNVDTATHCTMLTWEGWDQVQNTKRRRGLAIMQILRQMKQLIMDG